MLRYAKLERALSKPFTELKMSTRLRNCLIAQGWRYVADIAYLPRARFYTLRGLGPVSMVELEGLLRSLQVGVGLLFRSAANRRLWSRMRRHSMTSQMPEDDLFRYFCDLVQPRTSEEVDGEQ